MTNYTYNVGDVVADKTFRHILGTVVEVKTHAFSPVTLCVRFSDTTIWELLCDNVVPVFTPPKTSVEIDPFFG